jgi:hypothetical protein
MKKKAFNAYNHTQTYKNEWNDHLILNLINTNIEVGQIGLKFDDQIKFWSNKQNKTFLLHSLCVNLGLHSI